MKLILSSCDFSNGASKQFILSHLPLPIERCRVLFIPNEKATTEKIQQGKYHKRLHACGFALENIYVFDENFANDFVNLPIDTIYVSGGNTFLTLHKLRTCGFDTILLRYIQSGVTYIGGSAGAHMVTTRSAGHTMSSCSKRKPPKSLHLLMKIPSGLKNKTGEL